jgi:WD40-like Beta Propeller Repeat
MLTGNQIPSLLPEWTDCDPTVFRCFQDPGLLPSSQVSGLFSGTPEPDPLAKPVIVYPLAGSMHPINLADITFQWRLGLGVAQTLFRIRLQRGDGDVFEFLVPCNPAGTTPGPQQQSSECAYHMPPGAWIETATSSRGQTLTVDIAGVDRTHPGFYALSDAQPLAFTPEEVSGGLYYWSNGIQGTARVLFGGRSTQPFVKAGTPSNTATCGGCHAVSRDGSVFAYTQGEASTGVLRVTTTADATKPLFASSTMHDSGTLALNHDGSRVLVSFSGRLFLRDTATGAKLFEVDETQLGLTQHAFHPEWSPDDKSIVVTLSSQGDSDWAVRTGAIGVLPYNDGQFGPVEVIVPTGLEFNFYPTWSPDGHLIAFATAPVGAMQTSYDQVNARLRLVNRDTRVVTDLKAASGKVGSTSTWPKFAPASQAGGLMVLTFNSKMDYGFFVRPSTPSLPQIWMTVLDAAKLQAGADPSRPAVWMPFQDYKQHNYLGCWAERVGCKDDSGCGDHQICNAGACAMVTP